MELGISQCFSIRGCIVHRVGVLGDFSVELGISQGFFDRWKCGNRVGIEAEPFSVW